MQNELSEGAIIQTFLNNVCASGACTEGENASMTIPPKCAKKALYIEKNALPDAKMAYADRSATVLYARLTIMTQFV